MAHEVLGSQELHAMMVLMRCPAGTYCADIIQQIDALTGQQYVAGAISRALGRLEGKGLLVSTHTSVRGVARERDYATRSYRVTEEGRAAVARTLAYFRETLVLGDRLHLMSGLPDIAGLRNAGTCIAKDPAHA